MSTYDAFEHISLLLNYYMGDELSVDDLVDMTGFQWETVHKCVRIIEMLQNTAPRLGIDRGTVAVGARTPEMTRLFDSPTTTLAVYLFLHAKETDGDASTPIEVAEHGEILDTYSDTLTRLTDLEWIEDRGDTVRLTPLGIQIAGQTYSALVNPRKE